MSDAPSSRLLDFDDSVIAESGLIWNDSYRKLVDPETGEVYPLEQVVDVETATAASYRIFCNNYAIQRIDEQIKQLEARRKGRVRRKAVLETMYRDGLIDVARDLIAKAKAGQSTILGYLTVGWAKARKSCKVVEDEEVDAMWWALKNAPDAARVEIDLALMDIATRTKLIKYLRGIKEWPEGSIGGKVLTSKIDDEIKAKMPSHLFAVSAGEGEEWSLK